jgi:L-ascorbate metabolism protein UlaG (beta-lactamase superfamily)
MPPLLAARLLLAVTLLLGASGCSAPAPWPRSDHFDGTQFFNPGVPKESSVPGYLRLRLTTSMPAWPERVAPLPVAPPPARVDDDTVRVTLIGHATLLIQTAGLNVLTDPVWSERASMFTFAGPKRITPPALPIEALPPIDAVLISHNHYDHLDLATLRALAARGPLRVIAPLGNRALIAREVPGSTVSEHDWGERVPLRAGARPAVVHVEPMVHGSGRSPLDQQQTLWAAFVLDTGARRIYFAGDTAYGDGRVWRAVAQKFPSLDLALLPIGAYEPQWFMGDAHMQPSDAVRVFRESGAQRAIAHHFDVFQLAFEPYGAAGKALAEALRAAGIAPERFVAPQPGAVITLEAAAR